MVSVITPTYNHAPFLRETIESVLAQTFTSWEMIVVDDGSTDNTVEVAKSFSDPRIRVYARSHVGMDRLAETFNFGLVQARGELVGVVEGDDRWRPTKLALQVPLFSDTSLVVAYARYAVIGAHGNVLAVPRLCGPSKKSSYDAFPALLEDSYIMLVTTLMRRSALEHIGGFRQIQGHRHIDYATWLAMAELGKFIGGTEIVAEWRRHGGSATVRAQLGSEDFRGPGRCRDLALEQLARRMRPGTTSYEMARRRICRSWDNVLARRYWHAGRLMLAQHRWRDARHLFVAGFRRPSRAATTSRLLLGVALSTLRVDLDAVLRRFRGAAPFSDLDSA